MKKKTLKFGEGIIEVTVIDNIIYIKALHFFNDDIVTETIRYIDKIIKQIPHNPIRVWDSTCLSSKTFKVTSECIQNVVNWSQGIKSNKPGSKAFFIAPEPLIFGISRMYELQASDEKMDVQVIKNIDELPIEIREKIPV
ncbi:MAG: hypothetical protein A2W28_03540 [Gammaproteobacteria bacterium RBG_16_51_14]|nr:MAG: hypothetical protein A2W28_03540 [Gammaproteobacteria bacterium RBG_16_51_14]